MGYFHWSIFFFYFIFLIFYCKWKCFSSLLIVIFMQHLFCFSPSVGKSGGKKVFCCHLAADTRASKQAVGWMDSLRRCSLLGKTLGERRPFRKIIVLNWCHFLCFQINTRLVCMDLFGVYVLLRHNIKATPLCGI